MEAFFTANRAEITGNGIPAHTIPYEMFPRYFTWQASTGTWQGRKQLWKTKVGRVRWVHPFAGDIFYMRRLLLSAHGVGRTSFMDLRTVGGRMFNTYRDTAICLGLTDSDAEFHHAVEECARNRTASRLRSFYVSIMCMKVVDNPAAMITKHWAALTADWQADAHNQHAWLRGLSLTDKERALWALLAADLWRLVTASGDDVTAAQLGLPASVADDRIWATGIIEKSIKEGGCRDPDALAVGRSGAAAAVAFDPVVSARRGKALRATLEGGRLSDEQEGFLTTIKEAVSRDQGGLFFLSAGAGSGKTLTLSVLIHELRAASVRVRAMATSGIAATLLPEPSMTMHRGMRVPLRLDGANTKLDLFAEERLADRLEVFLDQVLVLDEACMSHADIACAMDRDLREIAIPKSRGGLGREYDEGDLMHKTHPSLRPYGGKIIIWAGHWAQTLPIVPGGTRGDTTNACLYRRNFWKDVQQHKLTKNFRIGSDPSIDWYAKFLMGIANGDTSDKEDNTTLGLLAPGGGVQELPEDLIQKYPGGDLVKWVYEVARPANRTLAHTHTHTHTHKHTGTDTDRMLTDYS